IPPTLKDRQNLQDVDEEVHYRDKERNRQADRVRQSVGHIFGALHVVEDVATEDGHAKERDEQHEERAMEENLHDGRDQQQDQAEEQVIAQARKAAFGGPRIDREAERGGSGHDERLAQDIPQAGREVIGNQRRESQPFQKDEEEEQEQVDPLDVNHQPQGDQRHKAGDDDKQVASQSQAVKDGHADKGRDRSDQERAGHERHDLADQPAGLRPHHSIG